MCFGTVQCCNTHHNSSRPCCVPLSARASYTANTTWAEGNMTGRCTMPASRSCESTGRRDHPRRRRPAKNPVQLLQHLHRLLLPRDALRKRPRYRRWQRRINTNLRRRPRPAAPPTRPNIPRTVMDLVADLVFVAGSRCGWVYKNDRSLVMVGPG